MRAFELFGAGLAVGSLITPGLAVSGKFYSSRHACPQSCSALGNETSNWTVYSWADRLKACNKTMLVNFNIHNSLDSPSSTVKISACVADGDTNVAKRSNFSNSTLMTGNNTESASVEISSTGSGDSTSTANIVDAAAQLKSFIANGPTTEQTIRFAFSGGAVVGVYSGMHIDSTATTSLLQSLSDRVTAGQVADTTIMQVCGGDRNANSVLGVVVDTTDSALASVQNIVASWNNATCFDLGSSADVTASNMTLVTRQSSNISKMKQRTTARSGVVKKDSECTTVQVVSGDSCSSLATECGITGTEFTEYNTDDDLCSTLAVGQYVCCSEGTLPNYSPDNYANGTCYTYMVESGDTCSSIAASYSITVDDIDNWNNNTWGWTGCDDLMADENICLSDGDSSMPASISNAECGPQVPGTATPSDMNTLWELNECPLNACCDIWGQCGITAEFCTQTDSATGAPGTAANGTNGCISNCGTEITNNADAPSSVMKVGYYEVYSLERSCLSMSVDQIPSDAGYTHIHFAFGNITSDYAIDISGYDDEFSKFLEATDYKRVASFGGWAFSTDADTYNIFREGVTSANRATLVDNIVSFVDKYDVDGVDFDWEYPGEPDIPDIPAGNDDDGDNYLAFLTDLKDALPDDVTVSIAAPASYWYLKQFPISNISEVVDYIIYMTYDLHGQWDYGNEYSQEGCPDGNCLRSHVNSTETHTSLAMITKAGVKSTKIVVGVSSYGRSFEMTDSSCTSATCTYTGPDSGATPGRCTNTAGYISNAELSEILTNGTGTRVSYHDDDSDSDIIIYDGNWVAYMSDDTKTSRIANYTSLNFAGTTDWAIDLQEFATDSGDDGDDGDDPGLVNHRVGSGTSCSNLPDSASGDSVDTMIWDLHKAACSKTTTYTQTNMPYQTVDCLAPAATNADQDQSDRWSDLYTDSAFEIVIMDYFIQQDTTLLTFPEYVSNYFNGPEGMNCGKTAASVGCESFVQCDDVNYPAGWFLLNSFVSVHGILYDAYDSCSSAESDMESSIGVFSSTFAQIEDVDAEVDELFTVLGLVYALAVAPMWNKVWKEMPAFKSSSASNWLSVAKDTTNALVSNGITLIKSSSIWAVSQNSENELSYYMGELVKTTAQALSDTNEWLFNGSDSSIADLFRVIDNGQLMEDTDVTSDLEMQAYLEQSIYSVLIPYAWSLSNENSHPFVIDTGYDCSDTYPDYFHDYVSKSDVDSISVCYNDNLYYLVDARDCQIDCSGVALQGSSYCTPNKFSVPFGVDSMDGTQWGGVTIENLTISAVNGYTNNGNANGWSYLDPTNIDNMDLIWSDGINAAGVVKIPVCDMSTAFVNWISCDVDADNYPCQSLT